jgi:hypothetical protein
VIVTRQGYRVYFPGDELPKGEHVLAKDGSVADVKYDGLKVLDSQPDPLIGFDLPDYEFIRREALRIRVEDRVRDGDFC